MSAEGQRMYDPAGRPPWTLEGGIDLDVADEVRDRIRVYLTDPQLERRFRRRYPLWRRAEYDEMIRALGYVWDCPRDRTANATGYCCAACGQGRTVAGG